MAVFRVRMADMRGDVADLLAVGARLAHALLRLPHLGSGDHLHRLGDLPGVLHTPDFHPDFLGARHLSVPRPPAASRQPPLAGGQESNVLLLQNLPLFFQSSMAAFSAFSSSALRSFLSSMFLTTSEYLPFT